MRLRDLHETLGQPGHVFTVDDANRILPLVKRILKDHKQANDDANAIIANRQQYTPEEARAAMDEVFGRLTGSEKELQKLGVQVTGSDTVQFPALTASGKPAFLTWRLGDSRVFQGMDIVDQMGPGMHEPSGDWVKNQGYYQ